MIPVKFSLCPFQARPEPSALVDIRRGDPTVPPKNACVQECALFLAQQDPKTGAPVPLGCAFSVLAVHVAQIEMKLAVVGKKIPGAEPVKEN